MALAVNRAFFVAVLALAGPAAAQIFGPPAQAEPFPVGPPPPPSEHPPEVVGVSEPGTRAWRAAIGLAGELLTDATQVGGVGTVSGDLYLDRLVDHPKTPLGLLTFAEHPNTLSFAVGNTLQGVAGTVAGSFWPWGGAGFDASVGGEDDPKLGLGQFSGALLAQSYFQPNIRGSLGYAGSRVWQRSEYDSADGVQGSLSWLAGRLLLTGQLHVAIQGQTLAGQTTTAASFWRSLSLTASYYIGRRWTVTVFGNTGWLTFGTGADSYVLNEGFGASGEVYLTDSLYLVAGVRPVFHQFSNAAPTAAASFADASAQLMTAWLNLTLRL